MAAGTYDVFISYKSEDLKLAEDLHQRLVAAGFDSKRIWFDKKRLAPGFKWHEEIEAGCEATRIVLPVLTPLWATSAWCKYETYGGECVIPLHYAGDLNAILAQAPPLAEWQGVVDLTQATVETWQRLFDSIQEHLSAAPPEKAPRTHELSVAANPWFVGRETTLLEMHEKLCQAPTTALSHGPAFVLAGLGGVGKTTLARQYAEKFWRAYHDILWVSAEQPQLLTNQFAQVAKKLGVAQGDDATKDAARALDELTRGPRRLLIVDNARDDKNLFPDDKELLPDDKKTIMDWLPTSGKCRTLITSRFTGWAAEVQTMTVHVLEAEPARELLLRRTGLPDTDTNRQTADALAHEVGYLPLALEVAAAHISEEQETLERYLELYTAPDTRNRARLLAEHHPGTTRYPDAVARTWLITVQKLSPAAQAALRILAFLAPEPLPRSVLQEAADIVGAATGDETFEALDEYQMGRVLSELRGYSLIDLGAAGGPLTIHRLLQAVQEDELQPKEVREWVQRALTVVQRAFPPVDHTNWTICASLSPHALEAIRHAAGHRVCSPELAVLSFLVGHYMLRWGRSGAAVRPLKHAIAVFHDLASAEPLASRWLDFLCGAYVDLGDVEAALGNSRASLQRYQQALEVQKALGEIDPNHGLWQYGLAVAHHKAGDAFRSLGDLPSASKEYEAAVAISQRFARAEPEDTSWQLGLSVGHENLGNLRLAQGRLQEALGHYETSLKIAKQRAAADQGEADRQDALAVGYLKVGEAHMALENLPEALKAFEASLKIVLQLVALEPTNPGWQRLLSVDYEKQGDVLRSQRKFEAAERAYKESFTIRKRRAVDDAADVTRQSDLSVTCQKLGDVRAAQDDLSGAQSAYDAAVAIGQQLLKVDPDNTEWQRGLSVYLVKLGDARARQGDLSGASQAYEDALPIAKGLVRTAPSNPEWLRDLSVNHNRLGKMLRARGDLPGALREYEADLDIAKKLADANKTEARWQRDLCFSYSVLSRVAGDAELPKKVRHYYQSWLKVLRYMKAHGMQLTQDEERVLGELERALR